MKKLIAILAVFALVTGVAFAQSIGGQLQQGFTLLEGSNLNDSDVMSGGSYANTTPPNHEAKFSATFGDGQGGGRLVYVTSNNSMWGWLQWRPSRFFRIKVGSDGDGELGFPQIAGWGFTGEAKNSVAAVNDWNAGGLAMNHRNQGLNYGGFDGAGSYHTMLSFYPMDLLQVHVLSRDMNNSMEISDRLSKLQLIVNYTIEEVGTIRFAAVGEGGLAPEEKRTSTDIGNIFLAFHSGSLVPNLGFELGVRYDPPRNDDADDPTYDNINVGFGVNFTQSDFNLKVRGNVGFAGKAAGEDRDATLGFHILPNYRLNANTILFFHAGIGMEFADEVNYGFFINPYVWIRASEGLRFWAGLQIIDDSAGRGDDAFQFQWKIPFGFNFYF